MKRAGKAVIISVLTGVFLTALSALFLASTYMTYIANLASRYGLALGSSGFGLPFGYSPYRIDQLFSDVLFSSMNYTNAALDFIFWTIVVLFFTTIYYRLKIRSERKKVLSPQEERQQVPVASPASYR
jgi:hypothetical protein